MGLNTGLTQALSDGTNTYLYGNGRIAQTQGSVAEYFLGDALGSVRQLTDSSGAIMFASAYDPYGVTTQTYGASQTAYGFTNEYTDSYIKLIYLRSRWYDPTSGRFQTRDTWQGDYNRPLSLNRWMYVEGNPINRTDPSGLCWYPNAQTGRAEIDSFNPPSNGICSWFREMLQQNGWNIPSNATPDNWINYIPQSERARFLSSLQTITEHMGPASGESKPLWQIIYYGKGPKYSGYHEVQLIHQDLGGQALVGDVPVVIEAGGSSGIRTDSTGTYNVNNVFVHGGPGVDLFGKAQIHIGVQAGSSTGLYLEGELLNKDCGVKLALPDTGVYYPGGEVGVTSKVYRSHWILTTQKFVYDSGGYNQFGRRYAFPEGFDSYYVLIEGFDKMALRAWWVSYMSTHYSLEEKP